VPNMYQTVNYAIQRQISRRVLSTAATSIAAFTLCGSAFAQSVSLQAHYKAGESYGYQTSGFIAIPIPGAASKPGGPKSGAADGMKLPMNSTQQIHVLTVSPDGSADLEVTTKGASPLPGAMMAPANGLIVSKVKASPQGVLSAINTGAKPGGATSVIGELSGIGSMGSIGIYLPKKPVRIGDTWSVNVPIPQLSATANIVGTYVSNGQVGRYKTAHIRLAVSMPFSTKLDASGGSVKPGGKVKTDVSGKLVMKYEQDFAIKEGRLIKSLGEGATSISIKQPASAQPGAPSGGGPKSVTIETKVTVSSALLQ